MHRALSLLVVASMTSNAWAQGEATKPDTSGAEHESELSASTRAKGTAAAILPGLLLHGSGHWVVGEKETAYRLLSWEAIGFGTMVASAGVLGITGASRYGIELTIPGLITGTGLFLNTFLADLYGVSGAGRDLSDAQEPLPTSVELSYAYVNDPQFGYANLAYARAHVDLGRVAVEPVAWIAADDDNQRVRLPVSYRVWESERGESVDVTTALTHHRFGDEGFRTWTGELTASARLRMLRFGDTLRGSFVSANLGYGLYSALYDNGEIPSDHSGILISGFGYGFLTPKSGEIEFYYQHRRDSYVGGLSPSDRNGSGFMGYFGLRARQPISDRFALSAAGEMGSAWLFRAGLEVALEGKKQE